MKSVTCSLFMLLLTICLIMPGASSAQEGEATIFYGEDTAVGDIASYRGELYILRYEGLFIYNTTAAEEHMVTDRVSGCWESNAYMDMLLSDNSGLYGIRFDSMTLIRILGDSDSSAYETILEADIENTPVTAFLQEDILYLLETDGTRQILHRIPLSGEQETTVEVQNISALAAYRNGYAIAIENGRIDGRFVRNLSLLNLDNGKTEAVEQLDMTLNAITYDKEDDCVYMAGNSRLYAWQEDSGIALSAYTLGGDTVKVAAFGGKMVAVIVDNSVAIRQTGNVEEQSVLVLQQLYGRSGNYQDFLMAHPELSLQFKGDTLMTPEEQFSQDMINQSSDIDIYLLTDINLISKIYDKGYGVDLSGDETIGAVVNDMYTPFRDLFLPQNAIYAIPQSLFITMIGYDTEFFSEYKFEVPTSYDELLDLAELWLGDYAGDNQNAYFNPFKNGIELIKMLGRYADECTGSQQEIVYCQPDMANTLQKYMCISAIYEENLLPGEYGMHAFNVIDVPHTGQYAYMPLSINQNHQPVISGTDIELAYFVVNPFSENREYAIEFIKSAISSLSDRTKLLLLKSAAHPIERSDYASEKAGLQSELDVLHVALSISDAADVASCQAEIEKKEMELAGCENSRWDITQDEVNWYQLIVDRIVISKLNPLTVLQESQSSIFKQFQDGSIDANQFLKILDEKLRIIYLEAQ